MNRISPVLRLARVAAAALLALGLAVTVPLGATALPPDGAGPDTPGTSSSVWPSKVKSGDRLNFKVSGYPAGETVYIKIDDGLMCSDTSHGACVYHTQKLDKNGSATGSLVVPDLVPGEHWLRMLATGDVFDKETGKKLGYEGYTRRGGNTFTVEAGGSSGKSAGGSSAVEGGGTTKSDGKIEGGSVEVDLGEESPEPTPAGEASPAATESAAVAPPAPTTSAQAAPVTAPAAQPAAVTQSGVPVVGIAVLAGAVLVGGGALAWALARRNKLVKQAAAGPQG
ncbi:MAG: hypothetical protein IPJ61_01865 [Tessaracoccus sp.]|uniref:hypothetical protein n=1 Tax=Tessaracoccus sp. TaxID=1971211 RepID=UPI001EC742C7|nr:hypothetical protein [Tessaracoccus sp.]MBK7819838.1 hypothetical protein [Tessaracoccus sp.]